MRWIHWKTGGVCLCPCYGHEHKHEYVLFMNMYGYIYRTYMCEMWSESNAQGKITSIWIVLKYQQFRFIFVLIIADTDTLLAAFYPLPHYGGKFFFDDGSDNLSPVHPEAILGQGEASLLWLYSEDKKKDGWGDLWQIGQFADCLDQFFAIWTSWYRQQYGLGCCPSTETSPGKTIRPFRLENYMGLGRACLM